MERRFICQDLSATGACVTLDKQESHHLRTVLRAQPGESLILLDGQGTIAQAMIDESTSPGRRGAVICRLLERQTLPPPSPRLSLYVAPPRHKQMSQLVRQATELGVWRICPILTDYSVSKPDASSVAGWEQDASEACKQSGNPYLPTIDPPRSLAEAVADAPSAGYIGWVPADGRADLAKPPEAAAELGVWVGPEGGFSEAEACQLQAAGMKPLAVGRWTLRVETAVVALLATLHERLT